MAEYTNTTDHTNMTWYTDMDEFINIDYCTDTTEYGDITQCTDTAEHTNMAEHPGMDEHADMAEHSNMGDQTDKVFIYWPRGSLVPQRAIYVNTSTDVLWTWLPRKRSDREEDFQIHAYHSVTKEIMEIRKGTTLIDCLIALGREKYKDMYHLHLEVTRVNTNS